MTVKSMSATGRDRLAEGALSADMVAAAKLVSRTASAGADAQDHDDGFPSDDVANLARASLLVGPVPRRHGGHGLGEEPGAANLREVLRIIGYGSLALGRVYEGHVNALQLIARFGSPAQQERLFADAGRGHLFGVWNTEPAVGGLTLEMRTDGYLLHGSKCFASGAGHVTRALVTARTATGELPSPPWMLVVDLEPGTRADLSAWRAHGMRASATGTVDFTGMTVPANVILGKQNDYHRQPHFSGGAWRFLAVQLGGIEAVFDACRAHLRTVARGEDPYQLARIGEAAMAVETARLWIGEAASLASGSSADAERVVAYVNLARLAVERAGLEVLERAQRSVGLQGFLRGHPLERLARDLATYLRQPAPDRALTSAARYALEAEGTASEIFQGVNS